ncbi:MULTISPECIES: Mov34/MPN/PAD-1 family protein [Bacillales]|jgi:proteasome lid subunit RPN8/RPN11|uniref:Peptidase n=1 Tax=Brevibacillus aydinogluensis TaxID=927786 RepID=A0AA48RGP6_9BACL|nr:MULTISPECIES: M67 family metallopeptidase [Bacillales]NNV03924.1 M67 family peptidase [Brevibacillus sp. MCWH]REK65289.1 MAG: peptidase [Brevibacillus sp.]UFJ61700.1 M67 family metallopeptidase [Anoxybacillus sediminis]CAJ1001405.1 Peptidase [Brevibacillus aydinogluensis]
MYDDLIGRPFASQNQGLSFDRHTAKRLLAEAQEALPYEYSALLTGHGSMVTGYLPMRSSSHGRNSFSWDAPSFFQALASVRKAGVQWVGILHSHPTSPPVPSKADQIGWHYPQLAYWILSFAGGMPDLRLYQWSDGRFVERPYTLADIAESVGSTGDMPPRSD